MKTAVGAGPHRAGDDRAVSPCGEVEPIAAHRLKCGWLRILAWLGLGCIGAAKPGQCSKRCAPGCVRKPAIVRRRVKAAKPRVRAMLPRSAAGALAGRPDEALKQALSRLSSPGPCTPDPQRDD
jgi:hypothetical protein